MAVVDSSCFICMAIVMMIVLIVIAILAKFVLNAVVDMQIVTLFSINAVV